MILTQDLNWSRFEEITLEIMLQTDRDYLHLDAFTRLSTDLQRIIKLVLHIDDRLEEARASQFNRAFANLTSLHLNGNFEVLNLSQAIHLTSIGISSMSDAILMTIPHPEKITSLSVYHVRSVESTDGLIPISRFVNLRHLHLDGYSTDSYPSFHHLESIIICNESESSIGDLFGTSQIKKAIIDTAYIHRVDPFGLEQYVDFTLLSKLPSSLTSLKMSNRALQSSPYEFPEKIDLPHLEHLELYKVPLEPFHRLSSIRSIEVSSEVDVECVPINCTKLAISDSHNGTMHFPQIKELCIVTDCFMIQGLVDLLIRSNTPQGKLRILPDLISILDMPNVVVRLKSRHLEEFTVYDLEKFNDWGCRFDDPMVEHGLQRMLQIQKLDGDDRVTEWNKLRQELCWLKIRPWDRFVNPYAINRAWALKNFLLRSIRIAKKHLIFWFIWLMLTIYHISSPKCNLDHSALLSISRIFVVPFQVQIQLECVLVTRKISRDDPPILQDRRPVVLNQTCIFVIYL